MNRAAARRLKMEIDSLFGGILDECDRRIMRAEIRGAGVAEEKKMRPAASACRNWNRAGGPAQRRRALRVRGTGQEKSLIPGIAGHAAGDGRSG